MMFRERYRAHAHWRIMGFDPQLAESEQYAQAHVRGSWGPITFRHRAYMPTRHGLRRGDGFRKASTHQRARGPPFEINQSKSKHAVSGLTSGATNFRKSYHVESYR